MNSWNSDFYPRIVERRSSSVRLDGWKSICQYLGRCSRTTQRWHAKLGLPIRHLDGEKGTVFAYSDELDGWLRNRGIVPKHASSVSSDADSLGRRRADVEPIDGVPGNRAIEPHDGRFHSFYTSDPATSSPAKTFELAEKMWETASHSNLGSIARLYREVVDRDANNAGAFAGLCRVLVAEGLLGNLRSSVAFHSAKAAYKRAADIDSNVPSVKYAACLLMLVSERDWKGARRILDEMIEDQSLEEPALFAHALLCIAGNNAAEASKLLRALLRRRPLNAGAEAILCWTEYLAGRFGTALAIATQSRIKGHSGSLLDGVEALASIQMEELDVSIERMEAMIQNSQKRYVLQGALAYAYAKAGKSEKGQQILKTLMSPEVQEVSYPAYSIALVLIGLGETAPALQWLEASYRDGSLWSLGFQADPLLAPLRKNPTYQLLMSRISYPVVKSPDELLSTSVDGAGSARD